MRVERELGVLLAIVASVAALASCSSNNQQADAGTAGTSGNVDAQPFDIAVDGRLVAFGVGVNDVHGYALIDRQKIHDAISPCGD